MFHRMPAHLFYTSIMITPLRDIQDVSKPLTSFNETIGGRLWLLMSGNMSMAVPHANK
jgi:hypothetical protein